MTMRRAGILLALMALLFFPSFALSNEFSTDPPKWVELLNNGKPKEKRLALYNLSVET